MSYKEGIRLFKEGKYSEAIKEFQEEIRVNDQNHKAWNALGVTYSKLEQYESADTCYKKALSHANDNPTYEKNREKNFLKWDEYQKSGNDSAEDNELVYVDDNDLGDNIGKQKINPFEKPANTKDLTGNLEEAFYYAWEGLWGKWVRWIILIACTILPFFIAGYVYQILKGITPAPEPSNFVHMLFNGVKISVISFVYLIIPFMVGILLFALNGGYNSLYSFDLVRIILGYGFTLIITFILYFIFFLIAGIGIVRFARTGNMGSAFSIGSILDTIGKIGWFNYVITLIFIDIVTIIVYIILMIIPLIGWVLAWFGIPFVWIVTARALSNLYDSAVQ